MNAYLYPAKDDFPHRSSDHWKADFTGFGTDKVSNIIFKKIYKLPDGKNK